MMRAGSVNLSEVTEAAFASVFSAGGAAAAAFCNNNNRGKSLV